VEVPPLRARREDIRELAAHFVRQACQRFHVPEPKLIERELERARQYNWPGNVRELQNVVERAVILAAGGALQFELPQLAAAVPVAVEPEAEIIQDKEWRRRERDNVLAAMKKSGFRVSGAGGAAQLLGVNPATLTSRLKALGIRKPTQ
jgi:DNA-binding NtrC family response regulator